MGLDEEEVEKIVLIYKERYGTIGLFENKMFDGTEDTLKFLKDQGRKIYLATSKPKIYADKILKHFDIYKYFDGTYGASMDEKLVKKVDIINEAIKNEKLDIKDSIMVGDREYDIFGAKEIGMDSVFFTLGYAGKEEAEILKKTANYVTNDMQELKDLFLKI